MKRALKITRKKKIFFYLDSPYLPRFRDSEGPYEASTKNHSKKKFFFYLDSPYLPRFWVGEGPYEASTKNHSKKKIFFLPRFTLFTSILG